MMSNDFLQKLQHTLVTEIATELVEADRLGDKHTTKALFERAFALGLVNSVQNMYYGLVIQN